jgi:acyl-coenzyme A synthetase/AMP-(fatty) acid ligase
MVPSKWVKVNEVPKTPLDKDDRFAVRALLEAQDR